MKKTEILKALKIVTPGLDIRGVIEQSASFVFTDGHVTTYNDEISISTPLDLPIEGAVVAKEFTAVLSKWKSDTVDISIKGNELILKTKKVKAGIPIETEITLPTDFLSKKMKFKKLPKELLRGLSVCLFSTAAENVSAIMNCVYIHGDSVLSSDDYRITLFKMDDEIPSKKPILLPAKVVRQLIKYNVVKYATDGDWLHFKEKGTDTIFSCRALSGEYPDLEGFLDVEGDKLVLPQELDESLERSRIFSQTDDSDLVTICMSGGKLKIKARNDHGWIEESMKIKSKADAEFQVSPGILRDIMKITLEGVIGEQAILFETEEFSHVICRISEED